MTGRAHAMHGRYSPCAVYMNLTSDLGRPGTRQRVVLEHDHVHDVIAAAGSNLASTPREAEFKQVFHILPTNQVAEA